MPLHPKIRSALQAAAGQPPLETQTIAEARAQAKASYAPTVPVPVGAVEDIMLPGGHGGFALASIPRRARVRFRYWSSFMAAASSGSTSIRTMRFAAGFATVRRALTFRCSDLRDPVLNLR